MDTILLTLSITFGQLLKIPVGTHGGMTLLDISVILLLFLGLMSLKFKLKKPPVWIIAYLIFVIVALLSLFLTPITLTPSEFLTSISYTIRLSVFILLGWLIYSGALENIKEKVFQILFFSGVSLAFLGLIQLIFLPDLTFLIKYDWDPHYFRTVSTFLDPNFLGSYLVLTLIVWYLKLENFKKSQVFPVIIYLALLTTFSRGAYLAFIISFLTLSVVTKSAKLAITSVILFLVLLIGFQTYQEFIAQPRNISRDESAKSRLNTWKQGLELFQKYPTLGVGFNSYRYALREKWLGDDQFLQTHGASTNDSTFLYVLATTGIVGFISYSYFLLSTGLSNKIILIPALLGLISQSFFSNTLFYPHILIWIILVASTSHFSKNRKK